MKEVEKSIDPQLWHACAGSMVQIPPLNSTVFYFPQGHAEHSFGSVNFPSSTPIPPLILCRVTSLMFLADSETDEVYAKIKLVSIPSKEIDFEDNNLSLNSVGSDSESEKPASFAKTLTQSDANNGGGFSVPRYCAETIFPRLDYTADPPVQTVVAKDVHGEIWKFRHIYRGTPRRHLLTTGWSTFVNQKKLVAGDSIVFLRAQNGDLCVGIRRAKKVIGCGTDFPSSGWNSSNGSYVTVNPFAGFSCFLREDENKMMRNGNMNLNSCGSFNSGGNLMGNGGKVKPEMVLEAVTLAAAGKPFEVVYYPRASTPEFCVKASAVRAAMRVHWHCGMRFKMPFETEDSSRISWFMGTISSVQVTDPLRWPNSPWRLLQVTWDEPDLLQNVKRVSPWLVELVSNMPVIHLSPFSSPRKKLRLLQQLDFPLDGQFPLPSFSNNPLGPSSPLCCLTDTTPAGIQGARHAQSGISSSDFHLNNKRQSGLFFSSFQRFAPNSRVSDGILTSHTNNSEKLSCVLTIGNSSQNLEKVESVKKHQFFLFGQPILTEQQISRSCSSDVVSQVLEKSSLDRNSGEVKASSDGSGSIHEQCISFEKSSTSEFFWNRGLRLTDSDIETGHCKVFLESEDVGRTLDLSTLGSFEELHRRLANMFGLERSDMLSHVLYEDVSGGVKRTGDEPFSDFVKSAKRLTILRGSGSDSVGRTLITGVRTHENGLDASNKTGPLSIFA